MSSSIGLRNITQSKGLFLRLKWMYNTDNEPSVRLRLATIILKQPSARCRLRPRLSSLHVALSP